MRFLYTTDLHGDQHKYRQVLSFAKAEDYKLIHLGADLLPKGKNIAKLQKHFVQKFLRGWYQEARDAGIHILCDFGNDDFYSRKKYFREYGTLLEEAAVYWNDTDGYIYKQPTPRAETDYRFCSYPWVPVHPFGLLNGCKLDRDNHVIPPGYFYNPPRDLSGSGSLDLIPNVQEYLETRGSIESGLKDYHADNKTIMSFHCPPAGLELDVCSDGRKVGSIAIRNWIEDNPCALVLCGHIHESPLVSHVWKDQATNGSWVIQPGQMDEHATVVEIDTNNLYDMSRRIL